MKFTRKDTRDRHETEQHSNAHNIIKCLACGRYVTKRAFAEHACSEVCRNTSALAKTALEDLSIKFVGADDDPFLAALRMLKLFGPDTGDENVEYVRLKLRNRDFQESSAILRYESCVARLMINKLRDSRAPLRALGMAALLLGFMAMAGKTIWPADSMTHFEGAVKLFRIYHDSICNCDTHKACPAWSPFAPRNPEVGILDRLLKDMGVDHRLLEAYTPEDEAALTRRHYAHPNTAAEGMKTRALLM